MLPRAALSVSLHNQIELEIESKAERKEDSTGED